MDVFLLLSMVLSGIVSFLFLCVFIFYIPGFIMAKKVNNNLREDELLVLSFSLGFIIFFLASVIFSYIRLFFLVPIILFILNTFAIKENKKNLFLPFATLIKQKLLLLFLILGTLIDGFINFPNGLNFGKGHLYWSAQGHDGTWHIAVIEAIKKSFPPLNPIFSGEALYNYHYFLDAIIANFNKLFSNYSSIDLYFRNFTFLIAFLMGLSVFSFLLTWTGKKLIGYLGLFFLYIVGSFGYIVLIIQHKGVFGGEAIFWSAQNNTIIGNLPQAFSFILICAFLLTFYYFSKLKNKWTYISSILLGGFLIGFKVPGAIILLAGLSATTFFEIILRKNFKTATLLIPLGILNFINFKLITKGGSSLLIFEPWYYIRSMVVSPDRLDWVDLEFRRQFYLDKGGLRGYLRIFQYESMAFLIFLFGNLGIRIIGFIEIINRLVNRTFFKDPVYLLITFSGISGFLIPLLFLQKGVAYNTIQFMQYFLLFFAFFAAITLYNILGKFKNNLIKILVFSLFFLLGFPTIVGNLWEFYGKNPLAIISNQELAGLNYLKENAEKNAIILSKPFNPYSRGLYKSQPWPIYAWDSTAYISAYTAKQSYLTDEGQIRNLDINSGDRIIKANAFFGNRPKYNKNDLTGFDEASDIPLTERIQFLKDEQINYIYLRNEEINSKDKDFYKNINVKLVFENSEITIYQVLN